MGEEDRLPVAAAAGAGRAAGGDEVSGARAQRPSSRSSRRHAGCAGLLTLLEPVLNPIWVALVTPERPDAATYVGGAAILVALVLEATKKVD